METLMDIVGIDIAKAKFDVALLKGCFHNHRRLICAAALCWQGRRRSYL
jgi:hypothetical protein